MSIKSLPDLPEEIWEKILGKVVSVQDVESCSNTCQQWKILVESKRASWLFREILPILFPYISTKPLLKCRLVCSSWKIWIDKFLQEEDEENEASPKSKASHEISGTRTCKCRDCRRMEWTVKMNENRDIQAFLTMHHNHNDDNPFPGGSLLITCSNIPDTGELFRVLGKHILYLTIVKINCRRSPGSQCRIDDACLRLLPNLRKLTIAKHR